MLEAWDTLSLFESQDLVRQLYQKKHGRQLSAKRARDISASVMQGGGYFKSAASADRLVKPLLLYYGVQALARAAVMFLQRGRGEETLAQAHGVVPLAWQETFAQGGDVGELKVRIARRGTVPDFAEATQNRSLLRLGSSGVNRYARHDALQSAQRFSVADLLSRIPEVSQQYEHWRSDGRCVFGGTRSPSPPGCVTLVVHKRMIDIQVDRARVERVCTSLNVVNITEDAEDWVATIAGTGGARTARDIPGHWDLVYPNWLIGKLCFIGRAADGWFGSKPVALLITAYVLGMLGRYFPARWMAMVTNHSNDAATPTLLKAIATIEREFPQCIADVLQEEQGLRPSFDFGE